MVENRVDMISLKVKKGRASTFMWERKVGQPGREMLPTGKSVKRDIKRYRIADRLSYNGMRIQIIEEE